MQSDKEHKVPGMSVITFLQSNIQESENTSVMVCQFLVMPDANNAYFLKQVVVWVAEGG